MWGNWGGRDGGEDSPCHFDQIRGSEHVARWKVSSLARYVQYYDIEHRWQCDGRRVCLF